MLKLRDEGKVEPSTPLSRALPGFSIQNDFGGVGPTLELLTSHMGGMPRGLLEVHFFSTRRSKISLSYMMSRHGVSPQKCHVTLCISRAALSRPKCFWPALQTCRSRRPRPLARHIRTWALRCLAERWACRRVCRGRNMSRTLHPRWG